MNALRSAAGGGFGPVRIFEAATRSSFSADRQRANTASPISVTGMPRSSALMPVHLPVPFWPAVSRILSTSGLPSSSFLAKMSAGDFDQVAVELALVPLGEDFVQVRRRSGRGRPSAAGRPRRSAACRRTRCRCGPSSRNGRRRLRRPSRSTACRLRPWRRWPGRCPSRAATRRDCRRA